MVEELMHNDQDPIVLFEGMRAQLESVQSDFEAAMRRATEDLDNMKRYVDVMNECRDEIMKRAKEAQKPYEEMLARVHDR